MCDHHPRPPAVAPPRPDGRAIALEHGRDHDRDHALWTRRDFVTRTSLAAGAAFVLGGRPVQALSHGSLLRRLARSGEGRTLVLVQMAGGNDGLNTVVPYTADPYFQARPTIAIPSGQVIPLGDDLGLHPALSPLEGLWDQGEMAVLNAVGYPNHNLSHFRSTDIWASGSGASDVVRTGWTGRYVDAEFPDYAGDPPDFPVALRIGGASPTLLRGQDATLGMSLANPGQLSQLAADGTLYDESDVPATVHGDELAFVRGIYNASLRYRDAVVDASEAGQNAVAYPAGGFAESLAVIARLVKGGLGARLYVLQLGGFDTHSDQLSRHQQLLGRLADGMAAFYADLAADAVDEEVLAMTFSEFGRRVDENGSNGTDHGTAAPLFLFGSGLNGGLYGDAPDLLDLDNSGNLRHSTDFRAVYATVLRHWFGVTAAEAEAILFGDFEPMGFVAQPVANEPAAARPGLALDGNYPNPFSAETTVRYRLREGGPVRLRVFDMRGREVRTLVDARQAAGAHEARFTAGDLPSGTYLLRLDTAAGRATHPMTLVR